MKSATMPKLGTVELMDPIVLECLRAMTTEQRIQQAYSSNRLVRQRLAAHFADEHPDWNEVQIQRAVAERLLHGSI